MALRRLSDGFDEKKFGQFKKKQYFCRVIKQFSTMKHNAIIGAGVGKLGNAVFYVKRGQQLARVYQPTVLNPKTALQETARARFAAAVKVAREFSNAIGIGYGYYVRGSVSARNLFLKKFLPVANGYIGTGGGTPTVDLSNIPLSDGSIPQPQFDTPNFATPLTVTVPAPTNTEPLIEAAGTEFIPSIVIVVYCSDLGYGVVQKVTLIDEAMTVTVPASFQGLRAHVYAFGKLHPVSAIQPGTAATYPGMATPTTFLGYGDIA